MEEPQSPGASVQQLTDIAASLSDKDWEQTQIKTFTKWVNLYLGKRVLEIQNIATDFADGINIINLLEIISDKKLGKYNKKPKMKIHQIANLNIANDFITAFYKEVGIKVVPSPEQLNEGDLRAILGLIWVLILRFSIADIDEGGQSAKEGLLLWCQRNTANYEGVDIENFHTSWRNGLGFAALINKFRPDLLDYDALDKTDAKGVMSHAFTVAHEGLGIPPLLDPEDIADVPKPDEKSLMTYLAEYWKVFSADTKIFLATKRLNRAINRRLVNTEMRDEYLDLAQKLAEGIRQQAAVLEALEFGTSFDVLRNQYFVFEEYKATTKSRLLSLKLRVDASLDALQTKLQSEKFPAYQPPEEYTSEAMNTSFQQLVSLEGPYEQALTEALTDLFKKTFAHFDHDGSENLNLEELQACFSALSLELSESEAQKLFDGTSTLPFDRFVSCMMEKLVDSSDSTQIKEACRIVSKDNTFVSADALQNNLGEREFAWVQTLDAKYEGDAEGDFIDVDKMTELLFSPL